MRGRVDWTLSHGTLRITATGNRSIVLYDRGRAPALTEQEWQLAHVFSSKGQETSRGYATATLMIKSGRVEARDLCGAITGTATATATTIRFGSMRNVPDCTNPTPMPGNATIDSVLADGRVQYGINGNTLLLASDAGVLIYNAVRK
jgi:hypothetical protein